MAKNPGLRLPLPTEHGSSLVECMIETADCIRQLHTEFGGRAYQVWLVWLRWTADVDGDGLIEGDEVFVDDDVIGAGRPALIAEIPLLPTPECSSFGSIRKDIDATGNTERGGITVSQVSMAYSEDILKGLLPELVDPDRQGVLQEGVQFFYEIREMREAGATNPGTAQCEIGPLPQAIRRKFILDGTPDREPYAFEWTLSLVRADGERKRDGTVEGML